MAEKVICSSECETCTHCTLNETNKAVIKIYCDVKEKEFYFGQMIPCDDKELRKDK